ncbi:hypothetical protein D9V86_12180 [Bacteroidetes/Chlorobi group bacterium ChocPot_Mid]|nr:MAG: hypothetical protein D9V86_12180 [Bacteroidetes/Chlorobi group bacterium ChocPot_Mid]
MKSLCIIFCLIILSLQISKADQRNFVWTYEYMIMEPGKAEIEQYTTLSSLSGNEFNGKTSTELNFEAEIGMNKHYDFAVYQNFKQGTDGLLKYSGFKLRTRILIGEKNQFWMDPLIYLEYKSNPDFSKQVLEPKLILEKDFGDFRISINAYFEAEFTDEETEFIPKYAVGATYKFGELFNFGFESKGDKNGYYAGPTLSHGSEKLWVALGSLHALGKIVEGEPKIQLRMILGLHL